MQEPRVSCSCRTRHNHTRLILDPCDNECPIDPFLFFLCGRFRHGRSLATWSPCQEKGIIPFCQKVISKCGTLATEACLLTTTVLPKTGDFVELRDRAQDVLMTLPLGDLTHRHIVTIPWIGLIPPRCDVFFFFSEFEWRRTK